MLEKILEAGILANIVLGIWILGLLFGFLRLSEKIDEGNKKLKETIEMFIVLSIYMSFILVPFFIMWIIHYLSHGYW